MELTKKEAEIILTALEDYEEGTWRDVSAEETEEIFNLIAKIRKVAQ